MYNSFDLMQLSRYVVCRDDVVGERLESTKAHQPNTRTKCRKKINEVYHIVVQHSHNIGCIEDSHDLSESLSFPS